MRRFLLIDDYLAEKAVEMGEGNAKLVAAGQREHPLRIGSVKSHLGHLEAAAGAASVIKMLLAFRFGKVPGQANLTVPNRRVA